MCSSDLDSFLMEGLAETTQWFCSDVPLSDESSWAINRSRLERMAWNNAQIMANAGTEDGEVLAYLHEWAPGYSSVEARTKQLHESVHHPVNRTLMHSYGVGGFRHQQLAARLSKDERRAYMTAAYKSPLHPEQILDWATGMHHGSSPTL